MGKLDDYQNLLNLVKGKKISSNHFLDGMGHLKELFLGPDINTWNESQKNTMRWFKKLIVK